MPEHACSVALPPRPLRRVALPDAAPLSNCSALSLLATEGRPMLLGGSAECGQPSQSNHPTQPREAAAQTTQTGGGGAGPLLRGPHYNTVTRK